MSYLLNLKRSGSGTTLVLLHGIAGGISIWDPIIDELEKHFDVIRLDLLGYGHSPKPRIKYTIDAHIESIDNTLESIDINGPFHLIGLSMGSLLAMNYAIKYPDKIINLIGIGALFYKDEMEARHLMSHNIWARYALGNRLIGDIVVNSAWFIGLHSKFVRSKVATKLYTEKIAKESLMNPYRVFRSCLYNCILGNYMFELLKSLGNKKILFIHGAQDRWSPVENVRSTLKDQSNTSIKVIEECSHNAVVLKPDETASAILSFLNYKDPAR